ncbi:portal protein, partial [Acinetobacter baumannii]|uniref:phage portal protein family protein n=1 Tax=Acinetobacter baumannii TaxID=470 RepID=UPI000BCDF773
NMIKYLEQIQSKVIVGGTLISQADGKSSTNAQSKPHEIQLETLIKSDAKQLARPINDNLIDYLMRLNSPNIPKDRYPEFYFDTSHVEDMEV